MRDRLAVLESRFTTHEKRFDEFMDRTDDGLAKLLDQSSQWAAVRRTLATLCTMLLALGGVVGWAIHQMWPNGFQSRL